MFYKKEVLGSTYEQLGEAKHKTMTKLVHTQQTDKNDIKYILT